MPGNVPCFWIERADTAEETLRRYVSDGHGKCGGPYSYHNAWVVIGTVPWVNQEWGGFGRPPDEELKKDPRWPKSCPCGYEFKPEDEWQHNVEEYYRRPGSTELFLIEDAPPGAMWHCYWHGKKGPDGISLTVKLPDGVDWYVDWGDPSRQGWQRSGTVPNITASPSIKSSRYHGFLVNGVLQPCSDSET